MSEPNLPQGKNSKKAPWADFNGFEPWQFGHGEVKATCLWLKGLQKLVPTDIVAGREARVHRMPPNPNRWKERSRTLTGIAAAMASQWGNQSAACFSDGKNQSIGWLPEQLSDNQNLKDQP